MDEKNCKDMNNNHLKNENIPPNKNFITNYCVVCGKEFEGEEPKLCCSGYMCGCMGLPIYPIICSEECYNKSPFHNGKYYSNEYHTRISTRL